MFGSGVGKTRTSLMIKIGVHQPVDTESDRIQCCCGIESVRHSKAAMVVGGNDEGSDDVWVQLLVSDRLAGGEDLDVVRTFRDTRCDESFRLVDSREVGEAGMMPCSTRAHGQQPGPVAPVPDQYRLAISPGDSSASDFI